LIWRYVDSVSASALSDCLQAGIRVKMITGDHPQTAMSIGQMLGIYNASTAITGRELEIMDDQHFGTEALPFRYWVITFIIGFVMFLIVEIEKHLTRKFRTA
jgi:hypothetical protein